MFQNLARCSYARRATTNVVFASSPSIAYASRRFYATRVNEDIIELLQECAEKENTSATRNPYKVRSFRMATAAIEKLDFKIRHSDDLKSVKGIGPGIKSRINIFLGHEEEPPESLAAAKAEEQLHKNKAVKKLMTVPGIGKKFAEAIYDEGCDTIARLHLKRYKEQLSPGAKRGLKYLKHLETSVPRKNAETIVDFCKSFLSKDKYEFIITGDYRRGQSVITGPVEILIVDGSITDPIPTPPHPSTLKLPDPRKPTRIKLPFSQVYVTAEERVTSVLLNKIIRPLEDLGVISDMTTPGSSVWQGWMRVPKKGETWESRQERMDGIQMLKGDFHRVNITYVAKQLRGSALLALTGDEDYYLDCVRKAVQAGLYLNEWGLWEWEPNSRPHPRFQTTDEPHEKPSLGAMWGSETEADEGRWVRIKAIDEEKILNAIGKEYVPPDQRNMRLMTGKPKPKKRGPVSMKNA